MKSFVVSLQRVAAHRLCVVLALTLTTVKCLPIAPTASPANSLSSTTTVEDLLRFYNVSREDIEASRQQHLAAHHSTSVNHFPPAGRQQYLREDPASPISASSVQKAIRNSAAIQRKQEVFRQVMGFVEQNGRPPQLSGGSSSLSSSPITPPKLPFQPTFTRPDATPDGYGHASVGRIRYIQPSCDSPKHADEETSSSQSLSLHLFFNLSSIHSQTRNGYQLYVIGAKLRLLKFAEGEAQSSTASEFVDMSSGSGSREEPPLQSLRAVPFFDPLTPSDEEKIRVSVHNYTRALKRNRAHKKKLLDSQMALAKEEGYMELDIKLAARWWLAPGGRNFGLSLEVEDTDGQRKPATHFFRPRNCSSDGSIRTDELTDTADVASPVLELTVVEVPEGRNVFELPSSAAKGRTDDMESGVEDLDTAVEEAPRKHRHHSSRIHTSHEEQADEAVVRIHHPLRMATTSSPIVHGKHRVSHRNGGMGGHHGPRSTSSPVPTLATLEDHDLFRETEEEETARAEADEMRMLMTHPTNIFMQRIIQQHHQQQHNRPPHHPRGKENRRLAY